jgi:phosphoglycolate phosphatase
MLKAISHATGEKIQLVEKDMQFKEIYSYFRECYAKRAGTNSWLFDGALNLLKTLKENNIKTAIITNKEKAFTKKIINTHNLNELINIVISGDTLPVKKPNPEGIFHAMNTLEIKDLDDILFIGDSDTDIKAAQNANVECWAVPYGYNAGIPIEDSNPTKMIKTLKEITQIL